MDGTLKELVETMKHKFIFVGGKGGVGKTTTSSSIAIQLAKRRGKTLIISTDPAHNLSDAFNQQFSYEPTPVTGVPNLWALEIDAKKSLEWTSAQLLENPVNLGEESMNFGFMSDMMKALPGIDEAIVFTKLLKMSKEMDAEVVIFDTAPTGHTLKLLGFPNALQSGIQKIIGLKDKLQMVTGMLGVQQNGQIDKALENIEQLKTDVDNLKAVLSNPVLTTFVCVCIPEFLSVYETERLVQELTVQNIDVFNVVVNQIVFVDSANQCQKCKARFNMQLKYIKQIQALYSDFHVVLMPMEDEEVRGVGRLEGYGEKLMVKNELPNV